MTTTAWRLLPGARLLYAPIALRLIDDFSGAAPIERVGAALDRQDGTRWVPTDISAVRTASGVVAYPGLCKTANPASAPVERYRVRLTDENDSQYYRAAYRYALDGLEFDVAPWNDTHAPASSPDQPEGVFLWPGANYPFPSAVPVLRGRTIDAAGAALADARIATSTDRVLSDERGAFGLPVRLTTAAASILVVAEHARTGVSVSVTVPLPAGLASAIELQLV
jgi:hypothetical protein